VFPYCKLRQSGDRVIENGMLATTFEGYGLGNVSFSSGLDERWEFPIATERAYSYARSSWAPTGRKGFYSWHGDLSATITGVALTDNIATVYTTAAHNYEVGDTVAVSNCSNATFDGTYTITGVPTTDQFRYAKTATNVVFDGSATGDCLVAANGRLVSDFASQGSTTEYNVPGSEEYNADEAIDFIIASSEDPTS
jgi:hypothetical protein